MVNVKIYQQVPIEDRVLFKYSLLKATLGKDIIGGPHQPKQYIVCIAQLL